MRREDKWWTEARNLIKEIGKEEWERAYKNMKREGVRFAKSFNNGHRSKLQCLLKRQNREVPLWLRREAAERWEGTVTIEEQGGRNRRRRGKRGKEETMWESWREKRKEREEEINDRTIERYCGKDINNRKYPDEERRNEDMGGITDK